MAKAPDRTPELNDVEAQIAAQPHDRQGCGGIHLPGVRTRSRRRSPPSAGAPPSYTQDMADSFDDGFALFPLGLVALPHELVPLHIFEARYRVMIADCLEQNTEFGIVCPPTKFKFDASGRVPHGYTVT